jgi:hypothetical protein
MWNPKKASLTGMLKVFNVMHRIHGSFGESIGQCVSTESDNEIAIPLALGLSPLHKPYSDCQGAEKQVLTWKTKRKKAHDDPSVFVGWKT